MGRFTVAGLEAERSDMQPTGEHYLEFATTGAVTAATTPMQRREIAAFLRAMLTRPPISVAPMYQAHRAVIGAFLWELESFAILDADEEIEPADLRDPAVLARERERVRDFQTWAASERATRRDAYHDYVTTLLDKP